MIARNLSAVLNTLPEGVQLVAVSKFHPIEALQQAYDAGQRLFGESRVQELTEKTPAPSGRHSLALHRPSADKQGASADRQSRHD